MLMSRATWPMSRSMRRKLPPVMRVIARAASPSAGCVGVEGEPEFGPVQGQHGRHVVGVQWPVLVGESDPAVQLRVAGQLPFESGHADQDQADVVAVEVVPELFQALGFQPVCFVDDEQFGVPGIVEVERQLGVVVGVERAFDVIAEAGRSGTRLPVPAPWAW